MATYLVPLLAMFLSRFSAVTAMDAGDDFITSSCVVRRQFQSPFVTPLLDQVAIVTGCSSHELTPTSQEIHVISLGSSGYNLTSLTDYLPTVSLLIKPRQRHSTHAGSLVVVLHATNPVMWQLFVERILSSSRVMVLVTEPSQLVSSAPLKLSTSRRPHLPLRRMLAWVRHQYGAITSLSRISVANTVTLTVGTDGDSHEKCDTDSMAPTERVWASYIQPQPVIGCAAERQIYPYPRDVHIIELVTSAGSREVVLHIQPQGETQASVLNRPIVERELLVVLKCHTPIKWKVQSWGVKGTLTVVSEQEVEARSLPSYQPMRVEQLSLPNDTESLLVLVEGIYNPVLTLTKSNSANKVNIFVDKGKDRHNVQSDSVLLTNMAVQEQVNMPASTIRPATAATAIFNRMVSQHQHGGASKWPNGLRMPGTKTYMIRKPGRSHERRPSMQLVQEMELRCLDGKVRVSFPKDKVQVSLNELVGGQERDLEVTLTDPTCKAQKNSSHYYIESTLPSCGSRLVNERGKKIYYNQVLFWIQPKSRNMEGELTITDTLQDDEDTLADAGSGHDSIGNVEDDNGGRILVPLSFQCVYNLTLARREQNMGHQVTRPQSYKLRLYLDKNYYHMVPNHAYPVKVAAQDTIYMQSASEAGPYFGVMTEECWLSEAKSHHNDGHRRNYLIQHRCPSERSVKFLSAEALGKQSSYHRQFFSFQVKEHHVNKSIYVHCRLTPCSTLTYLQTDGVTACIIPQDYCAGARIRPLPEHTPTYHANVEVCGPVDVVPLAKNEKTKNSHHDTTHKAKKSDASSNKQKSIHANDGILSSANSNHQRLLFAGLSTEIVVGIAFASFVTGSALMALLWFIHLRTDPTRQSQSAHQHNSHRDHHHHHHSGCDLSGQSGSSTPSSQAPMTAHSCG